MNKNTETSNDCSISTFQSIIEENVLDSIPEKIELNVKNYDKDIEKICNSYYEGFIDSINELLQMKFKVKYLYAEVLELNAFMETASNKFITIREDMNKFRLIESNIIKAIEWLLKCLPVFECCSKFNVFMGNNQYYESLQVLEVLERDYLPTVVRYKFNTQMADIIPKLKNKIKVCSGGEFREFLENIRKFSSRIGDVSMRYTKQMKKKDIRNIVAEYKKVGETLIATEIDPSAYDLIDFSAIFRTYHIYSELGHKDFFEKDYRQQRRDQINLVLSLPQSINNVEAYKVYIFAFVGFFVVEDHIRNTSNEILSQSYLDEFWSTSLSNFVTNLDVHICLCSDADVLLRLKTMILLAINNLQCCGYVTGHLWDLLHGIKDHYNEILLQRWAHIFEDILEKENFLRLEIYSTDELDSLMEIFPFYFDAIDKIEFPMAFPFSRMVPKIYNEAKEFMYASIKFCENLPLMGNETTIAVRKPLHLLFTKSFSGCVSHIFRNPKLTLPQIIQIILDTKYLDSTAPYLNDFVCELNNNQGDANRMSVKIFEASLEAESEIGKRVCAKVDEFFDVSNYNWALMEPNGNASGYITDMIGYLRSTFQSFAHILPIIAQNTCARACKHISENILGLLLDDNIKLITPAALQQINLDLMQCEFFAASGPIPACVEVDLAKEFLQTRQLLDLLIMEEWSTFLHDYGKDENRYYAVDPSLLIKILDKIGEADKKTIFSVLKKAERDKKKLRCTVQKQLKNLVEQPH